MKKFVTMSAVFALLGVTPVMADHHEGANKKHHGGMFGKLDANNDGMVSKAEFMDSHEERFMAMDANNDGMIAAEEARAQAQKMHEKMKERKEKRLENNTDDNTGNNSGNNSMQRNVQ